MSYHRVRILHLSDLHERGPREADLWRRRRVLGQAWMDNLKALLEDGPVDLVCFTGDAADWGLSEEFERTTDFFDAILRETGLPWDRFFAVPGNHDIHRKTDEKLWKRVRPLALSAQRLDASRWMAGLPTSRDLSRAEPGRLLARQENYRAWLRSIGRTSLLPDSSLHPHLGYRQTLRLPGQPFDFHVIGLDSAWLCGSTNESGQLLLSQDQIGRLCDDLSGFRLLLVHHPLDDLADAAEAKRLLGERIDLLLRGHLHEPEVSEWADPDRRLRQMAAGCLYEGQQADQYPNACTVIEISLDDQGRPLRYDLRFRGWSPRGFWFDDGSLYRESRGGRAVWKVQPDPAPPQVQPRVRDIFVGREEELQKLRDLLLPESPEARPVSICAVEGMAGVGKSYLADRFAIENAEAFPGGYVRLVLDPKKPIEVEALCRELADRLEVRGSGPDLTAFVRDRLQRPRTLLHVENVDSPAAERGVGRLLRDLHGCAVIATGRVHDLGWEEGWTPVRLDPFGESLALDQLWTELGRLPAVPQEEKAHRDLVAALGFLPLAIHLTAGFLRSGGSALDLLRKLRSQGVQIEPFHRPAETSEEARTIISASFQISLEILAQQLGDAADRLLAGLQALGHAPLTGFGRSLGAAIAGLAEEDFGDLMVQAVKLSLLMPISQDQENPDGAWRIHPLLAELLRRAADADTVMRRMANWFEPRMRGDAAQQHESRQIQRWQEVAAEGLALVHLLPRIPARERIGIGKTSRHYAICRGPFHLWIELFESALQENPTDEERSELLWGLCRCAIKGGILDRALEAAQEMAEVEQRRGEERGRAIALGLVADILQDRGQFDEALRIWQEETIPVLEKIGDIRERAVSLGKVADILQDCGQLDEALRIWQEETIPVLEKIGDIRERAVSLGRVADILQARGRLDEALRIRQDDELPVYEKIGDVCERLVAWAKMALTYLERAQEGDRERANELLCKALMDADRLQIPEADQIRAILQRHGLACG
ncbi:MAG TPA: metallophosphoesterase [Thermoanaerobaculia bacterium]|nr:metallophosphoesterase [Thermoanaerobaculia bacterium]